MKSTRKSPQLLILLDILMLWVLALLSVPPKQPGIRYEFNGIPPGAILFKVQLPLNTNQREWYSFDLEAGRWKNDKTPFGRENFLCPQCQRFLPSEARDEGSLMISMPEQIRERIRDVVFDACQTGDCARTVYFDADGLISTHSKQTVELGL